jgi:hypothetical protein
MRRLDEVLRARSPSGRGRCRRGRPPSTSVSDGNAGVAPPTSGMGPAAAADRRRGGRRRPGRAVRPEPPARPRPRPARIDRRVAGRRCESAVHQRAAGRRDAPADRPPDRRAGRPHGRARRHPVRRPTLPAGRGPGAVPSTTARRWRGRDGCALHPGVPAQAICDPDRPRRGAAEPLPRPVRGSVRADGCRVLERHGVWTIVHCTPTRRCVCPTNGTTGACARVAPGRGDARVVAQVMW